MAKKAKNSLKRNKNIKPKKTSIGTGPNRKWHNKGGGDNGSLPSKNYTKRPRGQGARRSR